MDFKSIHRKHMSTLPLVWSSLIVSAGACLFSNSWLMVWAMLELNTLSFCAITMETKKKKEKESSMKYLVIQSIASSILVIFSSSSKISPSPQPLMINMSSISLGIKMAAAPFHKWFTNMSKHLSWTKNSILFTWQKMAPSFLISLQLKNVPALILASSAVIGALSILKKIDTKEILAYSSVFNTSWTISSVILSTKIFSWFLIPYWGSILFVTTEMKKTKKAKLNKASKESMESKKEMANMLNLAGMPPMMMFMAKWMVFSSMLKSNLKILPLFLLMISTINLYSYLRMVLTNLYLTSGVDQKLTKKTPSKTKTFILTNTLILALFT